MNPKLKVIFQRRSVRRYQEGDIPPSAIQDLLEAAMAAPSACARDPWHFIVIRDRTTLNQLADGLPNGQMLREAAVGIAVCGELGRAHDSQLSYMLQDCSAAIENILVAAAALGLGACWLGVHPRTDRLSHLSQVLTLPDPVMPVAMIALGRPGEDKPARTRFDAAKVHLEHW